MSYFLFIATFFITAIYNTLLGEGAALWWHRLVPFTHSGKAALSFILGALLWWPSNKVSDTLPWLSWREWLSYPQWLHQLTDEAAVERAIEGKRDPLELLLRDALGDGRIIAVTLKTGKMYIGNLTTNLNPAFAVESIHLLLRRSGHRDPDTQKLTIDVDYDKTHAATRKAVTEEFRQRLAEVAEEYRRVSEENLARLSDDELEQLAKERMTRVADIQNYEIVILTSEVVSVNYFDLQLYDEQFKPKEELSTSNQPDGE